MWRGLRKVIYLVPSNAGGRVAVRHVTATHASEEGAEREAAEQEGSSAAEQEGKDPSQAAANARSKISLTTTGEKDLESGSPATKGPAATGKTTTYSVELTKTPKGLGLVLSGNVVTEVKPDSQAARDGRIKVWASSWVTVRVKG